MTEEYRLGERRRDRGAVQDHEHRLTELYACPALNGTFYERAPAARPTVTLRCVNDLAAGSPVPLETSTRMPWAGGAGERSCRRVAIASGSHSRDATAQSYIVESRPPLLRGVGVTPEKKRCDPERRHAHGQ